MTCGKCEQCSCQPAPFEQAMNKAHEVLHYTADFVDHPQYDRIKYPNRVSVGDYYLGIHEDELAGRRIFIWAGDKPTDNPLVYINQTTMGLVDADAPPPMISSEQMRDTMKGFKDLLTNHFFQG